VELDPRVSPLSPPPRRGATLGHVVEVVRATIHEAQARARDQVPDGAGDEDLTGCGAARHLAPMWTAMPPTYGLCVPEAPRLRVDGGES